MNTANNANANARCTIMFPTKAELTAATNAMKRERDAWLNGERDPNDNPFEIPVEQWLGELYPCNCKACNKETEHYEFNEVENISYGEFVRRLNKDGTMQRKTYIRGKYDAGSKRYALMDCDDINREVFVKKGTKLAIEFTY